MNMQPSQLRQQKDGSPDLLRMPWALSTTNGQSFDVSEVGGLGLGSLLKGRIRSC